MCLHWPSVGDSGGGGPSTRAEPERLRGCCCWCINIYKEPLSNLLFYPRKLRDRHMGEGLSGFAENHVQTRAILVFPNMIQKPGLDLQSPENKLVVAPMSCL